MDMVKYKLSKIENQAALHKGEAYHNRLKAYEKAKRDVGNLVGWYGSEPDERVYNATMRGIVEVLRV